MYKRFLIGNEYYMHYVILEKRHIVSYHRAMKQKRKIGTYCENCGIKIYDKKEIKEIESPRKEELISRGQIKTMYNVYYVCEDCRKSLQKEKDTQICVSTPNLNDYIEKVHYQLPLAWRRV